MSLTLGLVGLPSSGKSTLINSLCYKRICQTGLSRTTTIPTLYGNSNPYSITEYNKILKLKSDDDINLLIIDLPGIDDAEDKQNKFNDIVEKYVTFCDIMFWVTDSQTAFLTQHEKTLFEKYKCILEKQSIQTGALYQIGIIMTKYDENTELQTEHIESDVSDDDDSIKELTGSEQTTLKDSYERVKNFYPEIHIIKFNAHGRIINSKKSSIELKKLIKKMSPGASKSYNEFNIKIFTNNLSNKKNKCIINSLEDKFNTYVRNNALKHDDYVQMENNIKLLLSNNFNKDMIYEFWKIIIKYYELYCTVDTKTYYDEIKILSLTYFIKTLMFYKKNIDDITCVYYNKYDNYKINSKIFLEICHQIFGSNSDIYKKRFYTCISETSTHYVVHAYKLNLTRSPEKHVIYPPIQLYKEQTKINGLDETYNYLFELDNEFRKNPKIVFSKLWQEKVKTQRINIYGDNENDTCIIMLINMIIQGNMISLMEKI